jgi:sec-independent protein translocase protein TatC
MSQADPRPEEEVIVDQEWDDEEGGGPVKTFLEHLEDLRWTLIKCLCAVVISMVVCFSMMDNIISILTAPLRDAESLRLSSKQQVGLFFEGVRLGNVSVNTIAEKYNIEPDAVDSIHSIQLKPMLMGTNWVISMDPSLENPIDSLEHRLKNYKPVDGFLVAFQLMLYGGLVIAAPFVIFFIGQFVLPALKIHEKKFLYQTTGFGAGLFMLGIAFCYFVMMKIAIVALVQFSNWLGFSADEWNARDYMTFVIKFMLAMGISFQLPVVLLTLVKVGLLDYRKLSQFRPYWVVINLTLCAFLTPTGDPFTLTLMALPLQLLYELSVQIARVWARKEPTEDAHPA